MRLFAIFEIRLLLVAPLLLASCEGQLDGGAELDAASADNGAAVDGPQKHHEAARPPPDTGRPVPDRRLDNSAPPKKDKGATFSGKPGEFVRSSGGRSYRLLVPSGYSHAKAIPLLVGFHGAGDSGGNFHAICKYVGFSSAAAPANFALLVPDTKSPHKDFAIWSGNPSNDVAPMKKEMGEILAIIKGLAKEYNIDLKRIHAFGFSDGGLFAAVTGMHYSGEFASLTVAGYGWGGFYPLVTPARKIPVQMLCGTAGPFYSKAQQSQSYLQSKGHPTRFLSASGVGHKFSGLTQAYPPSSLYQWMAKYAAP